MHMMKDIFHRKIEKNIIFIPVEDYEATQFDMSEDMKNELMEKVRSRAIQFLKIWYNSG